MTNARSSADLPHRGGTRRPRDGTRVCRDPRTRPQRQHDALASVFGLAGRSEELPTLNGASATMVTHVLASDLHHRNRDRPHRRAGCAGVVPGGRATVLRQRHPEHDHQHLWRDPPIGTTNGRFNRPQRRALAARDGGCVICGQAPQYTEAHHVIPWAVEQKTHVANGVLLCWFHHRTIDTGGWKIRMVRGHPRSCRHENSAPRCRVPPADPVPDNSTRSTPTSPVTVGHADRARISGRCTRTAASGEQHHSITR